MFRLLALALGLIASMLVAAQLVGNRHPLPAAAQAAEPSAAPRRAWAPSPDRSPRNAFAAPTVIARNRDGHFVLAGAINGRALELLVDTGADLVAIPMGDAAGLGIAVAPDDFRPILRTASGTANGAPVRIASLAIGGHELRDVEGVVVEGLDRVLLGQSALRRLGRVSMEGDSMEIGGS